MILSKNPIELSSPLRYGFSRFIQRKLDDAGYAFFLHGHAEQMVGLLHGTAAVRDDEKLRVLGEAAHVLHVARNVRLVECSLDLVHDAKRRRPHLQNRKVERDGHERHLWWNRRSFF